MITRKRMNLCVLGIALAACANAQDNRVMFTGGGGDDDWNNAANWDKGVVPGETNEAGIAVGTIKITNTVTVGYLKAGLGRTGPSKVIIDGGTFKAIGMVEYNSSTYRGYGSIIVQNGGSATFNSRFFVGFEDTPKASMILHDGTFRVASTYYHSFGYAGTEALATRTAINTGGVLDVDNLVLNSGVLDIAGGTLIVRRDISFELDQWIMNGRIIVMGGAPGWKIKATVDSTTGWTTVVAEPITAPVTVGKIHSAVFVLSNAS
jgi:hypothetical protein